MHFQYNMEVGGINWFGLDATFCLGCMQWRVVPALPSNTNVMIKHGTLAGAIYHGFSRQNLPKKGQRCTKTSRGCTSDGFSEKGY
eukprot:4492008-Amphidinium_carterae.1